MPTESVMAPSATARLQRSAAVAPKSRLAVAGGSTGDVASPSPAAAAKVTVSPHAALHSGTQQDHAEVHPEKQHERHSHPERLFPGQQDQAALLRAHLSARMTSLSRVRSHHISTQEERLAM